MQIRLKGGALKNAVLVAGNGPSLKKLIMQGYQVNMMFLGVINFIRKINIIQAKKLKLFFILWIFSLMSTLLRMKW